MVTSNVNVDSSANGTQGQGSELKSVNSLSKCPRDDGSKMSSEFEYGPDEKWRILRNVVCISMAFMIHFTAFVGATNLQSSINAAEGLGTVSLAAVYASLILSTIFLPSILIKRIGCKGALIASFISYMPYIAAQFYPTYYTVTPTAVLVGLGGGPFWCAQCIYLCVVADVYARLTAASTEIIVVRFFGIFYMIYEFGQIFGNLISSLVLSEDRHNSVANFSILYDVRDICGANFCPGNEDLANPNLERPPDIKIYTIAGIYLACMLLSVLVLVFGLDSLSRYNEAGLAAKDPPVTGLELLKTAARLLRRKEQVLLLPLTVWLGLEKAVIAADYTASFVSCAWGIHNIGYVMICYGVANSSSAAIGGYIVKLTGRWPVMTSAMLLHIGILITLLLWRPHPEDIVIFFLMAGLWGAADGVWNVQINALCGILAPGNEKAAYNLFRLWESVGYIVAYGQSAALCTDVKLYIVLGLLLLGMLGYGGIEAGLRSGKKTLP
ncbi:UNC93-like protein [Anabrus simplex]|uniref:UNC93-like protein n=1 Tax=Anabrus simplex TaxID=316456 RepID=UPI0035A3B5D5